jgi:patatin-like phospholipase/acyl hydrolase
MYVKGFIRKTDFIWWQCLIRDGYVITTNPSTASIAFAVGKAKQPLDQITVLSIGTGEAPIRLRRNTKGWGMVSANNLRPKNLKNLPPNGAMSLS